MPTVREVISDNNVEQWTAIGHNIVNESGGVIGSCDTWQDAAALVQDRNATVIRILVASQPILDDKYAPAQISDETKDALKSL